MYTYKLILVYLQTFFSHCLWTLFETVCPFGTFGSECRERCSGHCINKTCDHVLGVCPGGCQDGYVGTFCNNCKIQWFT